MFHRYRIALVIAVAVAVALGFSTGAAMAAKGQFSIGGNVGVAVTNGGAFSDTLESSGYKKLSGDIEYGGSLRLGVSPKASLDLEVNAIKAKSTTKTVSPEIVATEKAIATSLNLYYAIAQNDSHDFSWFIGAGPMIGTKWKLEQGAAEEHSKSKTSLYAQTGFEGMYKVSPQFGISARVLGRLAKASDVAWADDPNTKFDVNMSGVAFSLGLRAFFGGK